MDLIETQDEFEIHFSLMIRDHNLDAVRICVYKYRCGSFPETDINHFVCEAIQTGHVEIVKIVMVAPGVDLNYTDSTGKRMLHYASEIGVADIVSLMIRCGTAVNAADAQGYSALHHACRYGQTETVKVLVKEGAHLNRVRSVLQGESPLHIACGGGFYETVDALIKLGARVNIISADDKQQTPLHKAISGKKYDVIQLLCQNGADLTVTDAKGRSPLHLAAETGDIGTLCAILQHGQVVAPSDAEGRKPLHVAVKTKQQLVIEALIAATPGDVNAQDRLGLTPLHVAVINGQKYTVELLISANAKVDLPTASGETPLIIAVSFGLLDIVNVLLAAGSCPNIPDKNGVTALHKAQVLKAPVRLQMIETLIRNGTKMNQTDVNGYTPLDRCVFQSVISNFDRETLKLMIAAGAHLQPKFAESRKHRNSPLCWLVWRGDLESARFLVYAGWDLRGENWLDLPGKYQEQIKLLAWLQKSAREPRSLMHHCRQTVREALLSARHDREILSSIKELPLPGMLKHFMEFEGEKELLDK